MIFKLIRQFGDNKMTCSKLQVFANENPQMLMECDANEERWKDYTDYFPGCSNFCLPKGEFEVKLKSSKYSGMTVSATHSPGHNGTMFGYEYTRQTKHGVVLIGVRDDQEPESPEEWHDSMLTKQKETFERFNELVYRYALTEKNKIVVI